MMVSDIDFLVLCGGLGTRLRSVTDGPKVMAEIQGEPFLDFLLKYLVKQGAKRIILCAGYKAESLVGHYKQKFSDVEVLFSIESEPLGTGGALKNAAKFLKSDCFFALNGDCFTPINYEEFLKFYEQKNALGALVALKIEDGKDFGTIEMNALDEIDAFKEKVETKEAQYINAGIYCFDRGAMDKMPEGKFSIEYDFFPQMIGHSFYGFKTEAPFIDIGTPDRLEWAKKHLGEMI